MLQAAPIIVGIFIGVAVYVMLFGVLFDHLDDFREKLTGFLKMFPVSVILDYSFDYSLRIPLWLCGGAIAGIWAYALMR